MRKSLLTVAVAGAIVVGGTTAYAAIPDSSGVIHACYDSGGSLKVVDEGKSCPKGYTALTWNQQGAPGAPGAPGKDGVDGAGGDVYYASTNDEQADVLFTEINGNGVVVESLSLPAGTYHLTGMVKMQFTGVKGRTSCDLNGDDLGTSFTGSAGDLTTGALDGVYTLDSPGTATLYCSVAAMDGAPVGTQIGYARASLTAVGVGTAHLQ